MGFFYNVPHVALLAVSAALWVAPPRADGLAHALARAAAPYIGPLFGFFGMAEIPPARVLGRAGVAAGAAGLTVSALAHVLFGALSAWTAVNAWATAIAVGVLVAKRGAAATADGPGEEDGPQTTR